MSRIEQALRRAKAGQDTPETKSPAPEGGAAGAWTDDDSRLADIWGFQEGLPTPGESAPSAQSQAAPAGPARKATPAAQAPSDASTISQRISEKLVAASTTPTAPAAAEQYRQLAAALHHAQKERNLAVVMVASALAGEGKTLTSTNLALTLSESYRKRVLLIDADLRRPSVHEVFELPNTSGLTDGLKTPKEQKLPLIKVTERLTVLTAGRPTNDPMSLLTSERMKRLIEEAVEAFDWVIVDTPPVGLLTDANLLSALVDTAVLVVAAGSTPYDFVQRAVEAIGRDRIFGVVLNRVEEKQVYGGYSYGRYYEQYQTKE
jgi:capsular exopolysaccharide synthesis family protein